MKRRQKASAALGVLLFVCIAVVYIYVLPAAKIIRVDLQEYETHIAVRDDYTLHTTPLDKSVVEDICQKLDIQAFSANCQPNAVVYAPDFFDEIKTYFRNLPDQEKTYAIVQDTLGDYLVFCGMPDPEGRYTCRYDLRGDNRYPFFFDFNKDDQYYDVIATIGGS